MSIFPARDQGIAVRARLRGELKKTVLEAAGPRSFAAWDYPGTGGYDISAELTAASDDWPYHWTADDHDELCPVAEAWRWLHVPTNEVIGADDFNLDPFTETDLTDQLPATTLRLGCGLLLVDVDDLPGAPTDVGGGEAHGRDADRFQAVRVSITGRLPSRRGRGQQRLYSGLIALALRETKISLSSSAALIFMAVAPDAAVIDDDGDWLSWQMDIDAVRQWTPPYPFSP